MIAHADGETDRAAQLAAAFAGAGYDVIHQGTLLVGESLAEEASKILAQGHPVVVCGTVLAVGTGWVHRILHAARHHPHCLVLPVRMDRNAYLEMLDWGASVAEYWQDPALAITRLCATLAERYPQNGASGAARTDHHAAEERYRALMLANYDIYDWSGLPQRDPQLTSSKLELRRLYVALRVLVESSADTGLDPVRLETLEYERAEQRGLWAFQREQEVRSRDRPRPRVPIGERLAASRRLVVLGDPGCGKSTLLKWIATAYLLRLRRDPDWRDLPDVGTLPDSDLLPIMIRCRELAHDHLSRTFEGVLDQTLHKLVLSRELRGPLLDLLLARLAQGQALLMVDGIDEINDPQARAAFCELVERTHVAYPTAPIIVTSRIVGYREMGRRIGRGFEHVRVADLDRPDKDELARRWCGLTEPPSRVEAAAAGLIEDIHSTDRIERLTGNPLLLTTMAMVRRFLGRLPNRRGDLYAEAVQVLLNWRTDVGEPLSTNEALPQLEYIAYTMCRNKVQQLRLDQLVELCEEMRAEFPNIHAVQRHDPETFIRLVEHRTGLLNETGHVRHHGQLTGVFEFRHLTFQEYLAGLALARGHFPGHVAGLTPADAIAPLSMPVWSTATECEPSRLVAQENWREPIRLCATACNSSEVDLVLSAALSVAEDENSAAARPRAVLAALCLADEPDASVELAEAAIERLIGAIGDRDGGAAPWDDEQRPTRSELDEAAIELATSRWRDALEVSLIRRYEALPPIDRIPVGAVLGQVLASTWRAGGSVVDWTSRLCRWMDEAADISAIKGALCVGATADNTELAAAYRQAAVARRLIELCGHTSLAADASAWAMTRIARHYDPLRPFQYGPRGIYTTGTCWYLTEQDRHALDRLLDRSHDLGTGVLFSLLGVAREEHLQASRDGARKALQHTDGRMRAASAYLLGSLEDHASLSLLARIVSTDPHSSARAAAARALGWLGSLESMPNLLSALEDDVSEVRASSAIALKDLDAVGAVEPLTTCLGDPDPMVRRRAVAALGYIQESVEAPAVAALLQDGDPRVRHDAAQALRHLDDACILPSLCRAADDDDARVRQAAIDVIADRGHVSDSESTLEQIVGHMTDSSADVRAAATAALEPVAIRRLLTDLRERLADEDSFVQARALGALAMMGDATPVDKITPHIESDDRNVLAAATDALVVLECSDLPERLVHVCARKPTGPRLVAAASVHAWFDSRPRGQILELLRRHRAEGSAALRTAAVVGLGLIGEEEAVGELSTARPDCDWDTEMHVYRAVRQMVGATGATVLNWLATHDSPKMRQEVAERLGALGHRDLLSSLVSLVADRHSAVAGHATNQIEKFLDSDEIVNMIVDGFDHPHWVVRLRSAHVLRECHHPVVVKALLAHSSDRHVEVRRVVTRSLGGRDPELVRPLLLGRLDDDDYRTRRAAAWALGQTEQPSDLVERFVAMIRSPDPEARSIGVRSLPLPRRTDLCELVIPYLDDASAHVRRTALDALRRAGHPSAHQRLHANLRAPDSGLRVDAIRGLMLERDYIDRCLMSRRFNPEYAPCDPLCPITPGTARLAAFRLMLPVEEVVRRYEILAKDLHLTCTWLPANQR